MSESKHKVGDVVYIPSEQSYHIITKIIVARTPLGSDKDKSEIYDSIMLRTRVLAVEQNVEPRLFQLDPGSSDLIEENWLLENSSIIT